MTTWMRHPVSIEDNSARMWKPAWLSSATALVAVAAVAGCSHAGQASITAASPNGIPVTIATCSERTLTLSIDALGTVTPLEEALIKPRVDGQIETMPPAEGQEVDAGFILAQLDARPYRAQRLQQEALLSRDRALLIQAHAEQARYDQLARSGMASQDALELATTQAASLDATVKADEAGLEAARLQEEFTTVRAPFAGRIGLRQSSIGALVHSSDAAGLMTLTQMAPISVICAVSDGDLPRLRLLIAGHPGAPVEIDDRQGAVISSGTILAIDNQVDQASGQIHLRISCPNRDRSLWPGSFVIAKLPGGILKGTAVPSAALEHSQDGWSVVVVGQDHRAGTRAVTPGAAAGGWTHIHAGLKVGETVVVAGQYQVEEGAVLLPHEAADPTP